MKHVTKDSGKRVEFPSGFNRDVQENKPRYDLIPTSMLKRLAELYARGADKYGDCNWQKAETPEEYQRFIGSAFRHFEAWRAGEEDEDHAMGAIWNIIAYEWHMEKEELISNLKASKIFQEQSDYDEGIFSDGIYEGTKISELDV